MEPSVAARAATINELQSLIREYVHQNKLEAAIQYRCLDLVCEVGELSKELLRNTEYGRSTFVKSEAWIDELGDVMFALLCLANSTSTDIGSAVMRSLNKYTERLALTGSAGSGDSCKNSQ